MDIEEVFKGIGSAEESFKSCSGIHVKCVGCVSILTGAHVGVVIIATHAACKMNREISFSLEEKKMTAIYHGLDCYYCATTQSNHYHATLLV